MFLTHHQAAVGASTRLAVRLGPEKPYGPGGADRWLRAWPGVLVGHVAIPEDIRSALVDGNSDAFDPLASIDYGVGAELGEPFFDRQAEMVERALQALGLERGRDYGRPEYSGILCGPGCEFHIDDGFGSPGVLFVVTSVLGKGVVSFPHLALTVPFDVGATLVFDALQVHGVCAGAGGVAGGCPFVAIASEVPVTAEGCRRLGLLVADGPESADLIELRRNGINGKSGEYRPPASEE